MSRGIRAGRRKARFVALLVVATAVVGVVAGGAAADDDPAEEQFDAIVQVVLPNHAAIDDLIARDVDLVEYVRDNDDGTVTVNAVVNDQEKADLAAAGFQIGATIEDHSTWLERKAERDAALAAEERSHEAAETGTATEGNAFRAFRFGATALAASELTVNRVDYFQNSAGWFLSVEVFDSLVNGTGSTGPTVSFSWKTASGSYGAATTIPRYIDSDPSPDFYMYNRVLVRIGPASPPYAAGVAPTPPAMVRVATSTAGVDPVEAPVKTWLGNPLPSTGVNFGTQYFTAYMDPTQVKDRFESLATEFGGPGGLAELVTLPEQTSGYQRKSMCMMFGTTACTGSPGTTSQAVYLEAKLFGQGGGNNIRAQFRNPGAANSPLSVTVTPYGVGAGQSNIVVNLATNASSALTSTAAQVVAAINASPDASALVSAFTYGGNAGTGVVPARALVNLSDFLNAPGTVSRGPFTMKVLRIGKHRDGSKTGVFLFCQQHAREWVTPITCLQTAELLLRNYATDPHTQELLDNLDIFILPTANPDGSHYSFYDFASQRKNMTRYCPITATTGMPTNRNTWGVDLNRNSSQYSLFDGYFGASTVCTNDLYAGPSEVSEPETRNLSWVVDTFTNIKFANNIHTYGGYFMWAPGSYIGAGRVTAPPPNHGIEAYFFAAADGVLGRIKSVRGTSVLPGRTGPIADVLYSAAGNGADDLWYRKGIIAYSFEAGSDRFTSTTTGTGQSEVGFMPNFTSEGRFEAQEFAAGNYGLLESALAYQYDHVAPEVDMTGPRASKTPIDTTFQWVNEPSVVYYTTDGSAPTFASTKWERQRMRGPGQIFTFNQTTLVRWLAVDITGNSSSGQARFAIDSTPPVTTADFSPTAINAYYKNPTITLTADDAYAGGGAGVDKVHYVLDGGSLTEYTAPFQVTGDGPHSLSFYATDLAGNVEAPNTVPFAVDATKPEITLTTPANGGQYLLNSSVAADYSCLDQTSGLESCVGTVPNGSQIDTASVGSKTFTVDAKDVAGNTDSSTRTYNVYWPFTGFTPPFGVRNQVQAGSSFPVKFALGAYRGLSIFAAGFPKSKVCGTGDGTLASTTAAEPLYFANGAYTYTWKTLSAWKGTCRELVVTLSDNTEHRATFQFK